MPSGMLRCIPDDRFAPRPLYVFFAAPDFTPGLQSGSVAFSKPRGLYAWRVKLVVLCGEPFVAKADDMLFVSRFKFRGTSSSLVNFESFEDSGRRSRLHRDVVQGSSSSPAMMMCVIYAIYA
jgi:hypothetical protein